MEALDEKKSLGKHCKRDGRKEAAAVLDKGTTRTKTSFSPGDEESAGKVPSSEEEIDFWQVRTRARTTYIVACALVADARRCSAHVEP